MMRHLFSVLTVSTTKYLSLDICQVAAGTHTNRIVLVWHMSLGLLFITTKSAGQMVPLHADRIMSQFLRNLTA